MKTNWVKFFAFFFVSVIIAWVFGFIVRHNGGDEITSSFVSFFVAVVLGWHSMEAAQK